MYIIYCKASKSFGYGHLFRSIVIYNKLQKKRKKVLLLINKNKENQNILSKENINHIFYTKEIEIIKKIKKKKFRNYKFIIDIYKISLKLSDCLKKNKIKFVCIDDSGLGAKNSELNIVFFRRQKKFFGKKILFGLKYFILNPRFKFKKKKYKKNIKGLVFLGGADTYNIINRIVLKNIKFNLDYVPGRNSKIQSNIIKYKNIKLYKREKIYSLFQKSDYAITNGGISAIEAISTGTPTFCIANEKFEVQNINYLKSKNMVCYLGFRSINFKILEQNLENKRLKINKKKAGCVNTNLTIRKILKYL